MKDKRNLIWNTVVVPLSAHAGSESDRASRAERKEEIVEEWAIPEESPGSIHHYYRGEQSRANTWRTRLDASTNGSDVVYRGEVAG